MIEQGEFLDNLGITIRADQLKSRALPQQTADIDTALHRLTDAEQMGQLFKVLTLSQ